MNESGFHASLAEVDFEAVYRGGPLAEGLPGGVTNTPWDIGEPQPALIEVEAAGQVRGEVLDVGCGLGENAMFLAERGHRVTGVDVSPTAVARAGERARRRGVAVTFAAADATRLDGFDGRFDTILDSALFHCLAPDQRGDYAAALRRACAPGATLHLFCGTDSGPGGMPVPYPVSEAVLRGVFAEGWRIEDLDTTLYTAVFTRPDFAGVLESMGADPDGAARVPVDDSGRLRLPIWRLRAVAV